MTLQCGLKQHFPVSKTIHLDRECVFAGIDYLLTDERDRGLGETRIAFRDVRVSEPQNEMFLH